MTGRSSGCGVDEMRLQLPPARGRHVALLAVAVAGLVYCAVSLGSGGPGAVAFGTYAACVSLAAAVAAIRGLLASRSAVRIDRDGITSGPQRLLWSEVGAVTTRPRGRARVVYVGRTVDAERRYWVQASRFRRVVEPAHRQVFHAVVIHVPRRARLDAIGLVDLLTRARDEAALSRAAAPSARPAARRSAGPARP